MREFFKNIVINLYSYCGNRQAEKMTNDELTLLYDALERVSKTYNYIPEEKQKEIIEAQLFKDKDYQNINARLISKWLEENGKQYFSQECHQQSYGREAEGATPLTGEARDNAIQEYLNAIAKAETNFTSAMVKGSGQRIREQLDQVAPLPKTETSALEEACGVPEIEQTGNDQEIIS